MSETRPFVPLLVRLALEGEAAEELLLADEVVPVHRLDLAELDEQVEQRGAHALGAVVDQRGDVRRLVGEARLHRGDHRRHRRLRQEELEALEDGGAHLWW